MSPSVSLPRVKSIAQTGTESYRLAHTKALACRAVTD